MLQKLVCLRSDSYWWGDIGKSKSNVSQCCSGNKEKKKKQVTLHTCAVLLGQALNGLSHSILANVFDSERENFEELEA